MEENKRREKDIRAIITQLGVGNSYRGYEFMIYGIGLVLDNPDCLVCISKSLYMDIAIHFHTSWQCVERALRTLIAVMWKTDNQLLLYRICGHRKLKKPKNRQFFELMYQFFTEQYNIDTSEVIGHPVLYNKEMEIYMLMQENDRLRCTIMEMEESLQGLLK